MTLLLPLGLLALLAIGVLLLIWIIRPNYQQKYISSTYVWRLSLKLKKKKIPISKLRNLLLILCQVLFLACCALALAQPALITRAVVKDREVIAIIDSSASMRAGYSQTRFDRAVEQASELVDEVFDGNGLVTVIVAGTTPEIIAQREGAEKRATVENALNELTANDVCSYGESDIDAAMDLCEDIIYDNPNAEIFLYTDITYSYVPDSVNVVNVSETDEWNASILNAYTVMEENYYSVYVEVACYGLDDTIPLTVEVNNANAEASDDVGFTYVFTANVDCYDDETITVAFRNGSLGMQDYEQEAENIVFVPIDSANLFYSYSDIHISIESDDAFEYDDSFDLYDGQREVLRVQYASNNPNPFIIVMLTNLRNYYSNTVDVWDMRITEVNTYSAEPATSGFDLYIFEHTMPDVMPTDGVVFLWDLDKAPQGSGLVLGGMYSSNGLPLYLTQDAEDNPLLNNITAENIYVTQYRSFASYDASYEEIMSCEGYPIVLAKNDGASKVVVLSFNIHYSNLAGDWYTYSLFMLNIMEQFLPYTLQGNSFSVYESVELRPRGEQISVTGVDTDITFTEFPATLSLNLPGTYTISQTTDFGDNISERIYVTIPSAESNIRAVVASFTNPYLTDNPDDLYSDLILYIAAAMVALVFMEWILQTKENM